MISLSLLQRRLWGAVFVVVLFTLVPSCHSSVTGSITSNHTHAALGIHHFTTKSPTAAPFELHENSWYTRYPKYPPYCSTPEMMNERGIPSLKTDYRVGDSRLVHVTSVIRHGARTPYGSNLDCWDGYWENGQTAIWNCNLTTFLVAPPSSSSSLMSNADDNVNFLFEKIYNALQAPLKNKLNGTCQVGQLLLRGFSQELANGKHLRTAYTFDGSNMDHNVRMRLLDLSSTDPRPFELLKYRSDDDQRTLMSGQVLLSGLFGNEFVEHAKQEKNHAVIPLHTADRDADILSPAESLCPKLSDLREAAENSHDYKAFVTSNEYKRLRTFIDKELGKGTMTHDALDCIMTTICTDRPLPAAIDDYGRNNTSTNLLQQIYESEIQKWSFHVTHNDGEYAKLAMGPLWSEILENIRPIINPDDGQPPPNRLALVSGHDTTILPLLVTLGPGVWDGQWPPYASMMIIEIHEIIDGKTDRTIFKSDFMFRLLMNGQALTSKIQGCPPDGELCDVQILMDRVSPFATSDRDCDSRTTHQYPAIQESKMLLSTSGGVILVLLFTLASGLLGSLFTFYYMTRRLPCRKRPAYHVGNGVSSYHDEIDGFQDEPEDVDGGDNAQLKTVAALVE